MGCQPAGQAELILPRCHSAKSVPRRKTALLTLKRVQRIAFIAIDGGHDD